MIRLELFHVLKNFHVNISFFPTLPVASWILIILVGWQKDYHYQHGADIWTIRERNGKKSIRTLHNFKSSYFVDLFLTAKITWWKPANFNLGRFKCALHWWKSRAIISIQTKMKLWRTRCEIGEKIAVGFSLIRDSHYKLQMYHQTERIRIFFWRIKNNF